MIERMETRLLMSSSAGLKGTTLQIVGTSAADIITVELTDSEANVFVRVRPGGEPEQVGKKYDAALIDGVKFATNLVRRIRIRALAGDDRVEVRTILLASSDSSPEMQPVNIPCHIQGGAGNDLLLGGNPRDVIDGNGGNDQINGGEGGDRLDGGAGDDRLNMPLIATSPDTDSVLPPLQVTIGTATTTRPYAGSSIGDDLIGGSGLDFIEFTDGAKFYGVSKIDRVEAII